VNIIKNEQQRNFIQSDHCESGSRLPIGTGWFYSKCADPLKIVLTGSCPNLPTGKLTFHVEVKKTLRRQQLADVYTRAIDNQLLF